MIFRKNLVDAMTQFPDLLKKLHQLDFNYDDGIDFEPYQEFLSSEETHECLEAYTGNDQVDGSTLRIFGQDGTCGYAAFWVVDKDKDLLNQPIVFLGSEGENGVVAKDFNDYLWLLTQNHGLLEAIQYPENTDKTNDTFFNFAKQYSQSICRPVMTIIEDAQNEHSDFAT